MFPEPWVHSDPAFASKDTKLATSPIVRFAERKPFLSLHYYLYCCISAAVVQPFLSRFRGGKKNGDRLLSGILCSVVEQPLRLLPIKRLETATKPTQRVLESA